MVEPKNIIINLKILGELDTGVKLNTRSKIFSLDDLGWLQRMYRMYRGEDRYVSYEKIVQLIKDLSTLVNNPNDIHYSGLNFNNRDEFLDSIKPVVEEAIIGLVKFRETYANDKQFSVLVGIEIDNLERINKNIKLKFN